MNLVRYEPKTYLDRFFDTDRLFNDFWPWAPFEGQRSFGDALKVNIVENDDNYTLIAEVPGMTEKDIDLEIKEGRMTLKGQVENPRRRKRSITGCGNSAAETLSGRSGSAKVSIRTTSPPSWTAVS